MHFRIDLLSPLTALIEAAAAKDVKKALGPEQVAKALAVLPKL